MKEEEKIDQKKNYGGHASGRNQREKYTGAKERKGRAAKTIAHYEETISKPT